MKKISHRDLVLATATITAGIHANPNVDTAGGPFTTFMSTYTDIRECLNCMKIEIEQEES
jgi:hypothetical protein